MKLLRVGEIGNEIVATLDSNNNIDNNNGGSVDDGFNSNDELIDTTNNTLSEKIELLEKIKNQSKFYDPETGEVGLFGRPSLLQTHIRGLGRRTQARM